MYEICWIQGNEINVCQINGKIDLSAGNHFLSVLFVSVWHSIGNTNTQFASPVKVQTLFDFAANGTRSQLAIGSSHQIKSFVSCTRLFLIRSLFLLFLFPFLRSVTYLMNVWKLLAVHQPYVFYNWISIYLLMALVRFKCKNQKVKRKIKPKIFHFEMGQMSIIFYLHRYTHAKYHIPVRHSSMSNHLFWSKGSAELEYLKVVN